MPQTIEDLGRLVKQKYPGQYDDLSDVDVGAKVKAKYPEYSDFADMTSAPSIPVAAQIGRDIGVGIAKGAANTVMGLGVMARRYIPGLAWASDRITGRELTDEDIEAARRQLQPEGTTQKIAQGIEQVAEYFIPGAAIAKGAKAIHAGARLAAAAPKLAKLAPVAEYGTRGLLEAGPAVFIAKAQGQEDTTATAAFAMVGPAFGKLLNKTASKLPAAVAEKIPEVQLSPRSMMWKALKPYVRNRDFDQALDRAMPEIYAQARNTGKKITSVDDFLTLLKDTKKRIWAPYEKFLGETGAQVDGTSIADAITSSVKGRQLAKSTLVSDEGEETVTGVVKRIYDWADKYRRKMPLHEAEEWLQNVNAEIKNFYNMYPAMRHAALEAHPEMAAAVAEAGALRQAINGKIEEMGKAVGAQGGTALDVKHIKEVYGGLLNLEQEAYRRVNVAKRLAPESLTEQLGTMRAAGEFAWGLVRGHPLEALASFAKGSAMRAAAKMIKERNTSDYLISKAFQDFGAEVEKARRLHRVPQAVVAGLDKEAKPKPQASVPETPKVTAKITQPSPVKPYTAPASIVSRPPQFAPPMSTEDIAAIESSLRSAPRPSGPVLRGQAKELVDDAVEMRLKEAEDIYSAGIGALSGKGKRIEGIEKMSAPAAAEEKQGFGRINVKSAIPELADFKEPPSRIAEAIRKDKDNKLYLKAKAAIEEGVVDRYASEIGAAQELSSPIRLKDLTKKGKKKKKRTDYSDVPF